MKNKGRWQLAAGLVLAVVTMRGMTAGAAGETVAEQEIYSQDGLTVTVTGLEESFLGTEVQLLVENDSARNLGVQAEDVSVNDYMIDSSMSVEVAPGKKANDALTILTDDFEEKGIDTVADVEFSLLIFDPETWETISISEPIRITTEGNESYQQEYDDSGDTVYDSDGIKIVAKGIAEDELFGQELLLYVENHSGSKVVVQADSTSVNGYMMDGIMSFELPDGKYVLDGMTFLESYLEENGIEKIEEVETDFQILDAETYMTIANTGTVQIEVE